MDPSKVIQQLTDHLNELKAPQCLRIEIPPFTWRKSLGDYFSASSQNNNESPQRGKTIITAVRGHKDLDPAYHSWKQNIGTLEYQRTKEREDPLLSMCGEDEMIKRLVLRIKRPQMLGDKKIKPYEIRIEEIDFTMIRKDFVRESWYRYREADLTDIFPSELFR